MSRLLINTYAFYLDILTCMLQRLTYPIYMTIFCGLHLCTENPNLVGVSWSILICATFHRTRLLKIESQHMEFKFDLTAPNFQSLSWEQNLCRMRFEGALQFRKGVTSGFNVTKSHHTFWSKTSFIRLLCTKNLTKVCIIRKVFGDSIDMSNDIFIPRYIWIHVQPDDVVNTYLSYNTYTIRWSFPCFFRATSQ